MYYARSDGQKPVVYCISKLINSLLLLAIILQKQECIFYGFPGVINPLGKLGASASWFTLFLWSSNIRSGFITPGHPKKMRSIA